MKNKIRSIDWGEGKVVLDDLGLEFLEKAPDYSVLKEDLLQVQYPNDIILDIGWYPEFSPSGSFHIQVIADVDWENPIFHKKCKTIPGLHKAVLMAIDSICTVLPKNSYGRKPEKKNQN